MPIEMTAGVISSGITVLTGIGVMLIGFRVIGRRPGKSEKADRWHVRYGQWFKYGGPVIVLGGVAEYLIATGLLFTPTMPSLTPEPWTLHTTADGACSIEFPQPPKHETDGDTDRLELTLPERDVRYSLTFSDLSPADAVLPLDELYGLLKEKFATTRTPGGAPARLVRDLEVFEGALSGREYRFVVGAQLVTRIKVFVRGPRVYRAIAVNPPDDRLDRDAQHFIDSFHFATAKP